MLRITTLAAITIAATQPAIAAPAIQYGQGAGERFEYTTGLRANGVLHITGVLLDSREPFVLDVTPKGHVDGTFGDTRVEYDVGKGARDRAAAQLGEGPALASADTHN
ncbi:hypothetical protein [Sphingomonas sp.]|uniref:hypothetical protein n=1 Tax=Sphingomonas sp. TaxID=28214 RepID=UPI0038AD2626